MIDAMKANGKLPNISVARLYNTWPNVKDYRPLVYARCTYCWDEKLFADVTVLVESKPQCDDCKDAEARAKLWSVLFRC